MKKLPLITFLIIIASAILYFTLRPNKVQQEPKTEVEVEEQTEEVVVGTEDRAEEKAEVEKEQADQKKEEKITYDIIDHYNAKPNEWDQSIIAIIDGDTLHVPLPAEPSDLIYSVEGDLNGNGYDDLLVISGTFGTCCHPNYSIASYDGKKFRLSKTLEWIEDYEIEKLADGTSLFRVHRELNSGRADKQIDETITYLYKEYDLEKTEHRKASYIIADAELLSEDLYDKDFKNQTEVYGREYIYMPYVDTAEENLRIICSPAGSRGNLEVYILNDTTNDYNQIIWGVGRVGVLPIEHEGYPLLVIDMDKIYTKDGEEYKGDKEAVYKQLREMGRM